MAASLDDHATIENKNKISILNRAKTMSYDDLCAGSAAKALFNAPFCISIKSTRGLIQN